MKQREAIQHARNLSSLSYNQGILETLRVKISNAMLAQEPNLELSKSELETLDKSVNSSLDVIREAKVAIYHTLEKPQRVPRKKARARK